MEALAAIGLRRYVFPRNESIIMKIGNALSIFGIIICFTGFLLLPLRNFYELPYLTDQGIPGAGWKMIIQTGIYTKLGIAFMIFGGILYFIAKKLPKKYWTTLKDLKEIQREKKFRLKREKHNKSPQKDSQGGRVSEQSRDLNSKQL